MSQWADQMMSGLDDGFAAAADANRAVAMAKYMRNQFEFFGIGSRECKAVVRQVASAVGSKPSEADLRNFARASFERPQREFQYAGVGVLRARVKTLTPASVSVVRHLVTTKSWWDTVDEIASHLAGGLVSTYPDLAETMDDWAASEHMWTARTAILHQLRFKARTDVDRLFAYCLARADEPDFFYRKAIGWALREYAKTDSGAVRRFCNDNEDTLSPLSLREARKHL